MTIYDRIIGSTLFASLVLFIYHLLGSSSIGLGSGGVALNAAAGAGGLAGDLMAHLLGTNKADAAATGGKVLQKYLNLYQI